METMYLPHWFFQSLSDSALLSLTITGSYPGGVIAMVDSVTAKAWRKRIQTPCLQ